MSTLHLTPHGVPQSSIGAWGHIRERIVGGEGGRKGHSHNNYYIDMQAESQQSVSADDPTLTIDAINWQAERALLVI